MAEKMYLNEEEAAARLRITIEKLTDYARDGQLQQYQDGAKRVYRSEEVDKLAARFSMDDTGEIELAPADTASGDAVSLSETEAPISEPGKEDTVITAEGISIFDDEDLEIEAADPMAKTQIAPSLEDQISLEGVGSGSGLLDLTRESDDTSLGAEVLDQIDMESGVAPSLGEEVAPAYAPTQEAVIEAPVLVEAIDPGAGLFSGFVVGCCLVTLMLAMVMLSVMADRRFSLTEALKENMGPAVGGAAVDVIACGVIGLMLGKAAAARQVAIRRAGG